MPFPFPNIRGHCVLCKGLCGARWKGYYVRRLIHDEYIGPVAIHVGHCFKMKRDFSYLPDFFLPGRRLSRPSFARFLKTFQQRRVVKHCIDEVIGEAPDEVDLPIALSTAYDWIYQAVKTLRLNSDELAIPCPAALSVFVFYDLGRSVVTEIFKPSCPWNPRHQIIIQPP